MNKRMLLYIFLLVGLLPLQAQQKTYKEKQNYKNWVRIAPKFDDAFFQTEEASRIGDNVLLYQLETGGWPKNIFRPAELSDEEIEKVKAAKKNINESTIDNSATTTEIRYLSRLYLATNKEKYKEAAMAGILYLLSGQYENGGWPQFWPRPTGYYTHITYNDNAMVNLLNLLCEIFEKKVPYTYVSDELCNKARVAFDKGIECILNTQIKKDGKLTVWCAQHDEKTLLPAKARAYEHPSFSGTESMGIVQLLMSLPNPSQRVKEAIENAVVWLEENKIEGFRYEFFTNEDGKKDYRIVPCKEGEPCKTLWARFYSLDDCRPIFCGRDGIIKYNVSEIEHERRNGYSWYTTNGSKLLRDYKKWKKKMSSPEIGGLR